MMSKMYLITGFLGSGKTTFLKNIMDLFPDKKIYLIINEFGKIGVDGEFFKKFKIETDEINNGSIFCPCRSDHFEDALKKALKNGADIILVESSGLSDPVNIRSIVGRGEDFPNLKYEGSICIADAKRFPKIYSTAVAVKKQLSVSDCVLVNKTDTATDEEIERTEDLIRQYRPDVPIHRTMFGKLEKSWIDFTGKSDAGTQELYVVRTADITFKKFLLTINSSPALKRLKSFLKMFLEDTYRVKGFVETKEGLYFIDCVGSLFKAQKYDASPKHVNMLIVLSGKGLPAKKSIKRAMQWYPDIVGKFE